MTEDMETPRKPIGSLSLRVLAAIMQSWQAHTAPSVEALSKACNSGWFRTQTAIAKLERAGLICRIRAADRHGYAPTCKFIPASQIRD